MLKKRAIDKSLSKRKRFIEPKMLSQNSKFTERFFGFGKNLWKKIKDKNKKLKIKNQYTKSKIKRIIVVVAVGVFLQNIFIAFFLLFSYFFLLVFTCWNEKQKKMKNYIIPKCVHFVDFF